jgi:DNA mismatch repair ATPase MutS
MNKRILQFAGLDSFLEEFQPLTPEGKRIKAENNLITDREVLDKSFSTLEKFISFRRNNPVRIDKIEYHLKRIPSFNQGFLKSEMRSELHNIKKFLHNYKAVTEQLESSLKALLDLTYDPAYLLSRLGYEPDQEESFFVRDDYSSELKKLRGEIAGLHNQLAEKKEERLKEIKNQTTLDFRFNDFLVITEELYSVKWDHHLFAESYDSTSLIVKPLLGREYQEIQNSLSGLVKQEKELENEILLNLAEKVEKERENLTGCVQSISLLDILLAKAAMAIKYDCVKPVFSSIDTLIISGLRFIPLKNQCEKENSVYTPLTAHFDARHIIISGSNMGGKTIVLKTLIFAQLLAQMGFYVPAESFQTLIFESFNLIGDKIDSGKNGLSSFGEEIMSLIKARNKGKTLYIIDEFARTTNSREAYALTAALLKYFSGIENFRSFSSTHQEELPVMKNVSYWMMKGLDYIKYREYYHKDFKGDLPERTALINSYMDYRIEPIKSISVRSRDALKIADILGLDSNLIKYAEKYMEKQEKQDEQ